MFGQFKNILPTNIRSISDSVGLNEEEWRTRGLERLDAIRTEFQNLILSRADQQQPSPTEVGSPSSRSSILELESVAQLVEKFRNDWQDIHEKNHSNFSKFQVANRLLVLLLEQCNQHTAVCQKMDDIPNDLASIHSELSSLNTIAVDLKSKLGTLEDRIEEATAGHTRGEFEAWKRQEQIRVKEELAAKRAALSRREAELKDAYREHDDAQTRKRVELYEATFNAELEDYRRRRETEVSSLYSRTDHTTGTTTSLDSVRLEGVDVKGLDMFLKDEENEHIVSKVQPSKDNQKAEVTLKPRRDQSDDDDDDDEGGGVEILGDEDYDSDLSL
ncbi:hypothetical protein BJV82DRAFT_172205 [Fennellomyces sp. T-0311]|nr:hypothetical protein BJV82DRAFT_172205 [Fennellomyces sp. T-0311]